MAIQNFLSGGFYGSIGEITGRRWKNKRVVQAKFKPKNPKTPAQEEQRRLFTRGSALAKIAQQVNWKAIQFENPIRTDWNQRQTIAINALKDGKTEWEALPLAPINFKAQHTIGECTLVEITDDNEMKVVLQGTNLLAGKKYACAVFITTGDKEGQIIVGSTPQPSTDALTASFRLPESDGIKGEECYIKIASIDDETEETVTLSAGIFLQQQAQEPYEFNPQLVSIEMDTNYTLRVKVKLGEEAIESYSPFTDINIALTDKAWTKETAVTGVTLDTDNWTNAAESFTITRTTVSKQTATVSFAIANVDLWKYEKFAAKIDISFKANDIKGDDSAKNTELVQLTAQAFPEYLQEEFSLANEGVLYAKTDTNGKYYGDWACYGQAYFNSSMTDNYKVLAFNDDWDGNEFNDGGITEITAQDGTIYTGDELEQIMQDDSPTGIIIGGNIGWYIQDEIQLKSWKGYVTGTEYCNGSNPIIAVKGFRCLDLRGTGVDEIPFQLKP